MKRNYKKQLILAILIILMIVSTIYVIYFFRLKFQAKEESNLLNSIKIERMQIPENSKEKVIITERMLQVKELQKQNSDIVGWIEIEGTNINYPVLQGTDNEYYLDHDYKHEKTAKGSIFLNKDYDWNIPSTNLLIYGHNMKNGEMFEDLLNYSSEEYYKNPNDKYNEIRDRFNKDHNALDFCLLSRTCYSGIIRFRKADGYMSTPKGPHNPIKPETFSKRVDLWHNLIKNSTFSTMSFEECMNKAQPGDVVYCDPPYTHSQSIIYGAQTFNIETLFNKIAECKARGVYVMLSINGTRESNKKDISVTPPIGLFEREIFVNCGTSMIDRLQNAGQTMQNEVVHDKLLLTW